MSFEQIDDIEEDWEALADRTGAPPFMRAGWTRIWFEAFGSGELEIATVRGADGLTAAMPLMRTGGALLSTTNWHTPSFEPPATDAAARGELFSTALEGTKTRLDLAFVEADGIGRRYAELARERGFSVLERTIERSPFVRIDGDWEAFEAERSTKFLRDLRRRSRRLHEQGKVEFEAADGRSGLEQLLDDGFAVEAAGWKGSDGTAIVSSPKTERFYRRLAEWAAARGWLRLWFLRLDGRALAFVYALVHDGVHYSLKVGFDPELKAYAPGRLLHQKILRDAFAEPLRRFDFLGADDGWKLEWTEDRHDWGRVQAFAPRVSGRANALLWGVGRPAAKRALEVVRDGRERIAARRRGDS